MLYAIDILKPIPSIPIYRLFSSRSENQKYFSVKFKNQNRDFIDQIKPSIKQKMKIVME